MGTEDGKNEAALVCAARTGDKEALCTLIERNWIWLKGFVCGIAPTGVDTDDILQDVCVQVIDKISTLRQPERFRPWLATIARNEALRRRRRNRSRPVRLDADTLGVPMDNAADPVEAAAWAEEFELIRSAIGRLPQKYRQVFTLAHTADLTYAQIAEILDIPVTTVQIRLVRARRMIYDMVVTGKVDRIPRT